MDRKKATKAIRETAKNRGLSTAEVIFEIEAAIFQTYQQAKERNDPAVLQHWDKIPCKGQLPTAEEFICYICDCVLQCE